MATNHHSRKLSGILICLLLSACSSGPTSAPDTDDKRAKAFTPASGKAAIYIYRTAGWRGSAVKYPVTVDGRLLGALHNGTYYLVEVAPGEHDVWVGWTPGMRTLATDPINDKLVHLPINAAPGEIYFVRASQKAQDHQMVDQGTGKRELLECCYLVPPQEAAPTLFK